MENRKKLINSSQLEFDKESIEIETKENKINFSEKCNLIVFEMFDIPIKMMGINESQAFNKKFKEILTHIKKNNPSKIKKIYYFDDILNRNIKTNKVLPPISIDEYINSFFPNYNKYFNKIENEFFRYVIVEFLTEKKDEKKDIIDLLCEHFYIFLKIFKIEINIFNDCQDKNYVDFHAICQCIYSSYGRNEIKYSSEKNDFSIKEKIEDIKEELKIKDFIKYVNSTISQINTNLFLSSDFLLQNDLVYKNLREEYYAIKSYILHSEINQNNIIFLGKETEPWDAKIELENKSLIIEVTQAIPKKEHITRQFLAMGNGYKNFPLKLRTIHQEGMDSFPQPIINAIEKKHKKKYSEARVLLVVVLAEFAYNDNFVLNEWLLKIREETILENFKEIWLVVDSEKLYRIH